MSAVQLALYRGKGSFGNFAIRWWTNSPYSHCELVIDGQCYSSSVMDKGVRCKVVGPGPDQISLGDHWDRIDLPWADADVILEYFAATDADRYGWPSLIASQIFNRNQTTPHAQFCSEWCAAALMLPCPASYSPGSLGELCAYVGLLTTG